MFAENAARLGQLTKKQFQISLRISFLFAAGLLAVFPLFFGVQYLDAVAAAEYLERFVSLIGIVLLVPLFRPEQDGTIREVACSRPFPQTCIILIRLLLSLIWLFGLIVSMSLLMKSLGCIFPFWQYAVGTSITALALGAAGFVGAGLTNNVVIGYCLSFILWFINLTFRSKLGYIYLFSMSEGDFRPKYVLLPVAIITITATFLIRYVKKRLE